MAKMPLKSLANPALLKPIDKHGRLLQVIIETPKGSRNKFAFDDKQNIFALKKVLPAGMTFPYDFGFLPKTLAPDGDPIDVLLLMDEPAYPGIAVRSRLIGIIEGEQLDGKSESATIAWMPLLKQITCMRTSRASETFPDISSTNSKLPLSTSTILKARNINSSAAKMPPLPFA